MQRLHSPVSNALLTIDRIRVVLNRIYLSCVVMSHVCVLNTIYILHCSFAVHAFTICNLI